MDRRKLVRAIFNWLNEPDRPRIKFKVSDDYKYILSVWPHGIQFDSAEYKEASEMYKELEKLQMYRELK
jgi:hypothetical protein